MVISDDNTVALANKIIEHGILTQKSYADCMHIANAVLSECDIIVSWNFKHIVTFKTVRGIKAITLMEGLKDLEIYPPTMLLEEDSDET